jgi:DNA polymerase-1
MSNCLIIENDEQLNSLITSLSEEEVIACDLEASELDIKKADIEGIGLGTSKQQYFIPYPNNFTKEQINKTLTDVFKGKKVVFHNAKYDLKLMLENGLPWPENFQDTMIMSWLIDEEGQHGLKPLAVSILGREVKKWKELGRGVDLFRTLEDVMDELADYCGDDVMNTYDLYFYFLPLLAKENLMVDYERLELKLIPVLVNMEYRGIKVNTEWLREGQDKLRITLNELEERMKKCLDRSDINIHSSKQLEYLLFNELKYSPGRVTDSGKRSTDNDVLEQIVKDNNLTENDFVPMLLKFRELDKIYSTYFVSLLEQAGKEGVIHTNFMQHGTRTGRLASNDPNMQNIPTRSDEWNVRKAFIPRDGYKFLIADYSQIELRMLAHFSQDNNMVKTFMEGGDIHAKTMELTGTERRVAKAINFGLIYGMGPRTLAHTLGIKEDDAKHYIDKFFSGYPKVRSFIERVQQGTFINGYVEMITGRRRRFREIRDRRWFTSIQRQSINTKIQGSAADLIKVAMIRLAPVLDDLGAFQLIQIHDEIIIETPIDKISETKKAIKEIMESALKLRVPVTVKIVEGDYWVKD